MEISNSILSEITIFNKYAKYIPDKKRRETWDEICTRYENMMINKYPVVKGDIISNMEYVRDKKILPSMRAMQFAGQAIIKNNSRIYNCAFLPIDDYRGFSETMFLLLGGTGVGYSVQQHHVDKLPEILKPTKEKKYLVGDSLEGWADCIKALMKSYFGMTKYKPRFDFTDIRPKGSRLVTAGGKAPGPEPLKLCVAHIESILNNKKDGDKLTPLECHDILCFIANAVLSGGIRRSAMIALFSFDDKEMLECKYGNWWESNEQRGRANNSAVILRNKITKPEFDDLWLKIELSNAGEPGIYFTNDKDWGTNPCCEIALRPYQFCVAGDTKLITKEGIDNIENLVNKDVEIWNGEKWSKVKPYQTGKEDRLHRVYFNDGSYLDATDNHKFLVKNRFKEKYEEVETLDLIKLLKTSKHAIHVPRANIQYDSALDVEEAYDYGFVLGDGSIKSNYISADIYENSNKENIVFKTAKFISGKVNSLGTNFKSFRFLLDVDFCKELKYSYELPKNLFSWSRKSILEFVAGWADADGSNSSNGIRIYGKEDKIKNLQLLLTKIGINSSVNLMSKKGEFTNLCQRISDVWYVQITKTNEIPCQRLKCNNDTNALNKGKYQVIKKIETLKGLHKSYCLTEKDLHQCVFNNVLTKQCNLCEVNVSDVEDQDDLNNRVSVASFFGTLQAGFTDFHYLRPVWKQTTEKDALIGIGMTGIASNVITSLDLKKASDIVKQVNETYADIININYAARCTTIKPSGTTSCVLGTSSGIHAWHNDYYIRRIRIMKNDPLYTYLSIYHSELIEDDKLRSHDTAIICIPQKAPEGSIIRTESALELLERVKKFNIEWVKSGHRKGSNTNNVSATVSIDKTKVYYNDNKYCGIFEKFKIYKGLIKDEWKATGEWMWDNKDTFNGLSVLPYDNGSYVQAPFTDCSKEEYEQLLSKLQDIDLSKVVEIDDNTDLQGELACSGGQCEIK